MSHRPGHANGGNSGGGGGVATVISGFSPNSGDSSDGITQFSGGSLTFTGTGDRSTSFIYVNGVNVGEVVWAASPNPDGSYDWSFVLDYSDISGEGTYNIQIGTESVHPKKGTTIKFADSYSLTVDNTAPGAPGSLDLATSSDTGSSSTDNVTSDTTPTITGTGVAGDTITLYAGGLIVGSAVVAANGTWSITSTPLGEGMHNLTATATDAAGNVSAPSGAITVTIDITAPSAPGSLDLAAASDTGASSTDNVTSDTTPTITGTGVNGNTITLYEGSTVLGTAVVAGGVWSITSSSLGDGVHNLTATATDAAGNESGASGAIAVTIDSTAPSAPGSLDLAASSDSGTSSTDNVTTDTTPTITGTGVNGDTITLYEGNTVLGTAVVAGGVWSITSTALGDGVHNLTATATDAAGNESGASGAIAVTIDTTPPGAPTGLSATGSLLSGSAEPNAIIHIFQDSVPFATTNADGGGNWSHDVGSATGSFTATAEDAAGNLSSASGPVDIDGTVPDVTAPTASAPDLLDGSDSGASNSDNITNDATATFRFMLDGTVVAGDTIQLRVGTVVDVTHVITNAEVTQRFVDLTTTNGALGQGVNSIDAYLFDSAGNNSTTASLDITYDGTAPDAPAAPDLDSASDSGTSDTDDLTSDNTPTITGTGTAGETITLYEGATVLGTAVVAVDGTWSITSSSLSDGVHNLTATAKDLAGNESPASGVLAVTIDTTASSAPGNLDLVTSSDTGASNSDNVTSDNTPTITGTGVAGDTITLYEGGTALGTAVVDVDGTWSITSSSLTDGVHNLTAKAKDAAGNESVASGPLAVTIDTTASSPPGSLDLVASSDSGASNSDNVTSVDTPTITGTGVAGDTITLYDGATVLGTAVVAGNGTWSITSSSLTDGVHNLTATATDAAGNVSGASGAIAITIDTVAPNQPAVTGVLDSLGNLAPGGVTDDETPEIRGTAEAFSSVEVFINGNSIGTTSADENGNWAIIAAALLDAVYTVTAEATDAAGNTSALSTGYQMEVDAVADPPPPPPPGPTNPYDDPLYGDQWHLTMLGNIGAIWAEYDGSGVSVGIYDNGIDYNHPDLLPNYDASKHVWVGGVQLDPAPSAVVTAEHGTAVAGVIAADDNTEGGVGVAFGASITGINIFGGPADINGTTVTGYIEAIDQAYTFDIVNNSWGTLPDFNHEFDPALVATLAAFEYAVENGRVSALYGALGTIVVKAVGNDYDNSQEFLNASRYTVSVAAHDQDGDASWYTNRGANVLVSAPSSGSSADGDSGILTTDERGSEGYAAGDYTYGFGGTSSATPVVSGVVALMLDANANLGWRDVQTILAYSARKIGDVPGATAPVPTSGGGTVQFPVEFFQWFENAANNWNGDGLHFSEDYGFGGVDAYNAVRMAEVWHLFDAPQTSANEIMVQTAMQTPGTQFTTTVNQVFSYTGAMGDMDLEYVDVYIDFSTVHWAFSPLTEFKVDLISPSGTEVSLILPVEKGASGADTYKTTNSFISGFGSGLTWTFGVNAFRGEEITGNWTIRITDTDPALAPEYDGGTLNAFQLTFYGSAADANDIYHYTDEVFGLVAADQSRKTLIDTSGNDDWLNMAALPGNLTVNLASNGNGGASDSLLGTFIEIANGTVIENAVTGDGNDSITGNAAANQLAGMRGDDNLWGLGGDDQFIFYAGNGDDWIWDFTAGMGTEDTILLDGFGIYDFGTLASLFSDVGGNALISFATGDSITLANVASSNLHADDFVFV